MIWIWRLDLVTSGAFLASLIQQAVGGHRTKALPPQLTLVSLHLLKPLELTGSCSGSSHSHIGPKKPHSGAKPHIREAALS